MADAFSRLEDSLRRRYTIERELGQGGMATVYLAHDVKHDRKVALKVLKPELAAVVGADRFLAEIRTTANLQHPHILPLFDSGEADGFLYFVMPYVEGESLRGKLDREKQLPIDEAIRIAAEVADALEHAHARGVIHRDIKPANILLRDGHVQVADFGIALAVQQAGGARLTETGLSVGTPHYMSPEQASGDRQLDGRSDIYSLGCVLYEMLTGEPPHTGPTAQSILSKILTDEPRPLTELRRAVPPHVEAAVHAALEKLPADRLQEATDFREALRESGFSRVRVVDPIRMAPHLRRALIAAAIVAGLGWLLAGLYALSNERADDGSTPTPVRSQILLPDGAPLTFAGPGPILWQSSLALSRDGRWLAYSAWQDSTPVLYLRDMTSGEFRRVDGSSGAYSPFFSPDGRNVGFFAGQQLRIVAVSGGQPRTVGRFSRPAGAVWTDADRVIVADDEGWRPTSIPAGGGEGSAVSSAEPGFRSPSLLPGDEWVIAASFGGRLIVASLLDDRWYALTRAGLRLPDSVTAAQSIYGSDPQYVRSGHIVYLADGDVGLMAIPFDAERMEVLGDAVPVQTGLRVEGGLQQWSHFAISDDGLLVYAPGRNAGMGELALLDVRTRGLDTLTHGRDAWWNPRASPVGSQILVTKRRLETGIWEPWILSTEGSASEAIEVQGTGQAGWAWHPDGAGVLLVGAEPFTLAPDEASMYTLASRVRTPLPGPVHGFSDIDPANGQIVTAGINEPIRVIDVNGQQIDTLDLLVRAHLDISPDGEWLAFMHDEVVRVTPWPIAGGVSTVSPPNSYWPVWAPDRSGLYYWSASSIWFVPLSFSDDVVRRGEAVAFRNLPILPTTGWPFDVLPDGRLVVVVGPAERSIPHLEVIHSFFTVLNERAVRGRRP